MRFLKLVPKDFSYVELTDEINKNLPHLRIKPCFLSYVRTVDLFMQLNGGTPLVHREYSQQIRMLQIIKTEYNAFKRELKRKNNKRQR